MGTKLSPLKGMEKPGAGTYNPNITATKYNMPSFSVGQKLGSSIGGNTLSPGPGNYKASMITKKSSPSFGFGSSTRETGMKTKL